MRKQINGLLFFALAVFMVACNRQSVVVMELEEAQARSPLQGIDINARRPAKQLSDYGLFRDLTKQIPAEGVVSYKLNSSHFADGAKAEHFLFIPEGSKIRYHAKESLDFPVGSLLVQTLFYLRNARDASSGRRLVETRLLIHQKTGWLAVPYIWNEDQTDARRAVVGAKTEVTWLDNEGEKVTHRFVTPNMNQCKQCHSVNEEVKPIGVTGRNLNLSLSDEGGVINQLDRLVKLGLLEGLASPGRMEEVLPQWHQEGSETVNHRARAWLHVNCAHCHNPQGLAGSTGLDLTFDQDNPQLFGVYKPPIAAGLGSAGLRFSIEPGKPEKSFLLRRLESTELSVMMPTVGRSLVDQKGVTLIREWIGGMEKDADAEAIALDPMKAFQGALEHKDADLGRELFYAKYQCSVCHTAEATGGGVVGPNLMAIAERATPEEILQSIVAPNAKVTEGYATVTVETSDGEMVSGRVTSEDDQSIVFLRGDGSTQTVQKSVVASREVSEVSAMPALGGILSQEEAGALVHFLLSL